MGPPPVMPGSEKTVSFQKSILGPRPKHIIVNKVKVPVASDNEVKQFYKPLSKPGVGFSKPNLKSKTPPPRRVNNNYSRPKTPQPKRHVGQQNQPHGFPICLGVDLEPDEWIKDSGCSKHMTGNRKLFSTYKAYNGGNVIFGSNLRGNIIGKGTISNNSLKIDNVEHVDNLGFNLLSIGQICDNKCKVTFSEHDSEITKNGKVIGRGIRKRGLYVMKLGNKPKDQICLTTIDENSTLWHRRLGHANMRLIQSLASKDLVRNLPKLKFDKHFCDACKIGKQAHASHKAKNVVSTTRCLELLHMDLFGPSAVRSYGGNRYTLVIVDDYSRYTWTRFLKDKTEAFDHFKIFNEEEAIKVTKKKNLENDIVDETLEVDEIINIKESRNHPLENVIGNLNQRTLRSQAQNQSNFFCFISTIEPKNVNEALGDESWIVAMQEELNQFVANDVWELVPQPRNMTIIGTKWVFRNKLDENGIVSRNKARLVAQGYNQQEGIDYDETYAPVARLESIRILLAYACALDFKLFQMDVKSAFLNGFINEEVYVAQPPGFIDFEKPDHVYKLKKALYGLKQAPKAWYDRLKAFLIKHEYKMGMVDNTLFTKKKSSNLIIVQIYVDDIIFGSTCQDMCDEFAKIMHDEFEMSMMGELNFFLGLQIKHWKTKQTALAISTTEAEYVSAEKACQQALWMKQALIDYDVRLDDVPIMCDNKGMIDLSKNPVQHSRTKHIEIHHHFLLDNVQKGHVSIEKVPSVDNIVDILTKPLKRESFNYLRLGLGMMEHIPQIILVHFSFFYLNSSMCSIPCRDNLNTSSESFSLTLEELGQILKIPFKGQASTTEMWSLDHLSVSVPSKGLYKTKPPSPRVIKSLIQLPRQGQETRTKNKKTIVVGGHRDHVSTCLCHMLYCIETSTPYNLAFFILKRMEKTRFKPKELLPYDRGKKRPRELNASSSFSTLNHPSSSHPLDDSADENDDESSHSNPFSPSQNISSSLNNVSRVHQNPPHESHYLNTYLFETINLQTQKEMLTGKG
ncbi:retrovirus-related pol polyprotein from transposon TNT 1-94 [Tanacetum coccineum]